MCHKNLAEGEHFWSRDAAFQLLQVLKSYFLWCFTSFLNDCYQLPYSRGSRVGITKSSRNVHFLVGVAWKLHWNIPLILCWKLSIIFRLCVFSIGRILSEILFIKMFILHLHFNDYWHEVCMSVCLWHFLWWYSTVAEKLVEHVKKNDTLVVIGETGSGKTTRKSTWDLLPIHWNQSVC
jgi:hypothetical protein